MKMVHRNFETNKSNYTMIGFEYVELHSSERQSMEGGDKMNRKELLEELKKYMNHIIVERDEMPLDFWLNNYPNKISTDDMEEIGYHLRYACEYISKYVDR